MMRLLVAMPEQGLEKVRIKWDELTAGAWRNRVEIHLLSDDKVANDSLVTSLASAAGTLVFAAQHLTSVAAANQRWNVKRFKTYKLAEAVEAWLDDENLNWRTRTKRHCEKTAFKSISADEWVTQFAKVSPAFGRRAGAALLAQFRVAGMADFAQYFSDLPSVDQNAYFLGADPHSGDLALVGVLSANIDNRKLHDSRSLPAMKKDAKIRLFCDGSWSGGETKRRIHCMFKACSKKNNSLVATQHLDVRVGFITDNAERLIYQEVATLVDTGLVQKGLVKVSWPDGNRLSLIGSRSGQKGLAFHDQTLLQYVDNDPRALRRLCEEIGEQIQPKKPLGTNEIASCIALWNSLPAAMLPVFTAEGANVKGADGQTFKWKALIRSEHVKTGREDDPEHHCGDCPLADRTPQMPMASAHQKGTGS